MAMRHNSLLNRSALILALVAALAGGHNARAQSTTIDRPIVIYVAGTAGGGIDLYARLLARHIRSHIPGNPSVTVQDMPGAGGIKAANYLAEIAPRDGTALTSFASGPILEPLIGVRNPGYDMSQFNWIGAIAKDFSVCVAWGGSPFKTIDDVKKQELVAAGTGAGSETDTWPVILNELIGTKFKVVTGYPGAQETLLAIEKGEMNGRCGWSWSSLKIAKPEWLREKKINLLIQIALEKNPELPDVPFILDLVSKPEDRQLVELLVGPMGMARAFAAPPGLAVERVTLLRRAFDATMKDPEFLAEAAKMQADVAPSSGEQVQQLVGKIYATPRAVVERAKKLFARR
jgi:tripartite-type tricarboxylate transporter receptor subunit TctC